MKWLEIRLGTSEGTFKQSKRHDETKHDTYTPLIGLHVRIIKIERD
jgi:hypothetical protein